MKRTKKTRAIRTAPPVVEVKALPQYGWLVQVVFQNLRHLEGWRPLWQRKAMTFKELEECLSVASEFRAKIVGGTSA